MTLTDPLHPRLQLVNSDGTPTPFFLKLLISLREKTGGPGDTILEVQIGDIYETGVIDGVVVDHDENIEPYDFQPGIEVEDPDLFQPYFPCIDFTAVTKSGDYTALSYEFIAVTKKATIKLPAKPGDNDQVIVLNVNGTETITDGNGKNINDDTTVKSFKKNTAVLFHYFVDLDRWYMR